MVKLLSNELNVGLWDEGGKAMDGGYLIRHKSGMFLCQTPAPNSAWTRTDDPLLAFNTSYDKALRIVNNAFTPKERKDWYILQNGYSNLTLDSIDDKSLDEMLHFSEGLDYKELAGLQKELYNKIYQREQELRIQMSTCDRLINDTMHFIEFTSPLDLYRGFKTYKLLRQLLQRRRDVKNEIEKATGFLSYGSSDFAAGKMEKLINTIEDRSYQPRIMDKLFDAGKAQGKSNSITDFCGNEDEGV